MQALFKRIALVAATDVPVLITGETGTGKELVARAIHRHSRRQDGPFLPICPAALSPGLIEAELFGHVKGAFTGAGQDRKGALELAQGGTVLLDEVGDIPLAVQVKLLRMLEHREITPVGEARPRAIDIRVIAATHRPLAQLMETGAFREDLFFRLGVFPIEVPPLRDRRDDIPALAAHFLGLCRPQASHRDDLTPEAVAELMERPWVGNVRELRNAIEHAAVVARGEPIRGEHLPARREVAPGSPTGIPSDDWSRGLEAWARSFDGADGSIYERFLELAEPALFRAVLERYGQNRAAAAQALGLHRGTLRQKLRRHGLG
jgi:two-component system nitrogen regulation response regulator GlnG